MDSLRTPFFVAALVCLVLVVLLEIGSVAIVGAAAPDNLRGLSAPGLGIAYLALYDGIVLYAVGLMGLAQIVPARLLGRIQGIVSLVFFVLLLIATILLIIVAIGLLTTMITLVLAVPFGLAVYLAAFGNFAVGAAQATLGAIMLLKLGFVICLVLAQQRFLQMRGLIILVAVALLLTVLVGFLHGLGPRFLVSILDAIAAIIIGIAAAIWALISLIGTVPSIVKALRVDRALA